MCENQIEIERKNNGFITKSEVETKLDLLVEGQTNNSKQLKAIRDDLQKSFMVILTSAKLSQK